MKKGIAWLTAGLVLGATVPAISADSLLKRVRKLERRADALALLAIRDLRTDTYRLPMIHRGEGFYVGSVRCSGRGVATGGGVVYPGGQVGFNNRIHSSYQSGDTEWSASAHAFSPGETPYVQVVCVTKR